MLNFCLVFELNSWIQNEFIDHKFKPNVNVIPKHDCVANNSKCISGNYIFLLCSNLIKNGIYFDTQIALQKYFYNNIFRTIAIVIFFV
jgi:hypothetical protein